MRSAGSALTDLESNFYFERYLRRRGGGEGANRSTRINPPTALSPHTHPKDKYTVTQVSPKVVTATRARARVCVCVYVSVCVCVCLCACVRPQPKLRHVNLYNAEAEETIAQYTGTALTSTLTPSLSAPRDWRQAGDGAPPCTSLGHAHWLPTLPPHSHTHTHTHASRHCCDMHRHYQSAYLLKHSSVLRRFTAV